MATVAPRLGLSGPGLAKICERLGVPRPGRGYWAKKAAGHQVRRARLPAKHDGPTVYRRAQPTNAPPKPEEPESVQRQRAYEATHPIKVPERGGRRPELARKTFAILRRQDGRTRAVHGSLNLAVSKDQLPRAVRIMSTLIREAGRRGFTVTVDDDRTYVRVSGGAVEIRLEEPYRKEYGPPSEWEVKMAPLLGRDPRPSVDLVPTGTLHLKILEYADGLRKTFRDTCRQRVEDRLNDFMISLVAVAEVLQERKRQWAEWRRQREEAALRRAEEMRREEEEKRRVDELRAASRRWDEANRLKAYLDAVREAAGSEPDAQLMAWLEWAEEYATREVSEALAPVVTQRSAPPTTQQPAGW